MILARSSCVFRAVTSVAVGSHRQCLVAAQADAHLAVLQECVPVGIDFQCRCEHRVDDNQR